MVSGTVRFAFAPPLLSTLTTAVDLIYPSDTLGPGAAELGVAEFLERFVSEATPRWRELFVSGLRGLDQLALERRGVGFSELSTEDAAALLTQIVDDPDHVTPEVGEFIDVLIDQVNEAVFADPAHLRGVINGGWQLVGYPGPRLLVTAKEQQFDAVLPVRGSIYLEPLFAPRKPA